MKFVRGLIVIVVVCLGSIGYAQDRADRPGLGRHAITSHGIFSSTQKFAVTSSNRSHPTDIADIQIVKTWDLGMPPGGTYVELSDVNDFGFAVGTGDILAQDTQTVETRSLGVALFGPHKGEWIDMGSLGGALPAGYDEPILKVSNTGLVATHSKLSDSDGGRWHAAAWTHKTGMVDLGTLADIGYPEYNSSYAGAVNRSGTLIVGSSSIEDGYWGSAPGYPVVWTPSFVWKQGHWSIAWKIHRLDITGMEAYPYWIAWDVNDYGQIIGIAQTQEPPASVPVLWNPLPHGKGWKLVQLPVLPGYRHEMTFGINNRGEIAGGFLMLGNWTPALWKPLDHLRDSYGPPIILKGPEGYTDGGWADGINDLGDISGVMWGTAGTQAVLWSSNDAEFSDVLGFPGDWSLAWKVNNFRIAVGGFGGATCPGECGGASQFLVLPTHP